jgi:hypothetical protein
VLLVLWPAFMVAALLEALVFVVVDRQPARPAWPNARAAGLASAGGLHAELFLVLGLGGHGRCRHLVA